MAKIVINSENRKRDSIEFKSCEIIVSNKELKNISKGVKEGRCVFPIAHLVLVLQK